VLYTVAGCNDVFSSSDVTGTDSAAIITNLVTAVHGNYTTWQTAAAARQHRSVIVLKSETVSCCRRRRSRCSTNTTDSRLYYLRTKSKHYTLLSFRQKLKTTLFEASYTDSVTRHCVCNAQYTPPTRQNSFVASASAWTQFATSSRRLPTDSVDNLETDQTDSIAVWLREFWQILITFSPMTT